MSAELVPWVPVRLCCGTQHHGPVCPGGLVMCCGCFGRVPLGELHVDEDGNRWDVCRGCEAANEAYWEAHPRCPRCGGYCTDAAQCAVSQFLGHPADWRHGYQRMPEDPR